MRAVIIYESMYGNTHLIADAIARGLETGHDVTVVPVGHATQELLDGADLIVVGGPTHIHGMSRARTRAAAVDAAAKPGNRLTLDPGPATDQPGLRDWFGSLGRISASAAAFDTRFAGPAIFTGRASTGIAGLLRRHGLSLLAPAESFLVTTENKLRPGEEDRAQDWGAALSAKITPASAGRKG
jgi:Flavodoxin